MLQDGEPHGGRRSSALPSVTRRYASTRTARAILAVRCSRLCLGGSRRSAGDDGSDGSDGSGGHHGRRRWRRRGRLRLRRRARLSVSVAALCRKSTPAGATMISWTVSLDPSRQAAGRSGGTPYRATASRSPTPSALTVPRPTRPPASPPPDACSLWAIDVETGETRWCHPVPGTRSATVEVDADGHLYLSAIGAIRSWDGEGNERAGPRRCRATIPSAAPWGCTSRTPATWPR